MDLPLHSCRPRLLSECGSQSSQLFSRRRSSPRLDLARGLFSLRDRKFVRILGYATRRDAHDVHSIRGSRGFGTRIPLENSSWEWRRVGQSHLGFLIGRVPRRSEFGIVHFEQGDRNCSDGTATNFENGERPPFDLDLAVVLAGFSFEAYNTPAVRNPSSFIILCFRI